ncbi:GlxA family transcriptional regulator (plasmid) [Rhodobacteraceae bacterium SC52]|uniref:GlxA family transcriptional regulator n=2 Tax=Meridianimarinicoccus aquatilis TaxID=2552766 RepID=A0A4V6PPH5_9RHOB|nr:GlxA family transcriptional regulator [Rhodobacteraceae bacterium SC52]TDL90539.1 GlxA family transcriptional regulator [Fluviibacterium aquatile]
MVAFPQAHILDIVGPLEVLTGTKYFLPEGPEPYAVTLVASKTGPLPTTSGLSLTAHRAFADAATDTSPIDTLIVSGGHGTMAAIKDPELLDFVRQSASRSRRIVSICTGAMILAEIGLLDGKRASTHWWWCPILEQRYPAVAVDRDAIFVRDGNIWTSAGVTAGMDLALALVEMDFGHDIALQVARYNVMYMMRPGGQSQFSAHLVAQRADDPAINATLDYILANPGDPLTVTALAARAGLSERTFARRFKDNTEMTPAAYVETARVQAARVALETTTIGVEQVALQTGFQNAERMRRAFQRHLGVSATDYRERFRGSQLTPLIRDGPD